MQTKKPTRKQKQLLTSLRLNADNWLIVKESADSLVIRHKISDKERTIPKELMNGRG